MLKKILYICIILSIVLFSVTACSVKENNVINSQLSPISFAIPYEPVVTSYVPYIMTKDSSIKYTGTSFYITMDIPNMYKFNEDGYYAYKTLDEQYCILSLQGCVFEVNRDDAFLDKCITVYSRLNPGTVSPQFIEYNSGQNTYTYLEKQITFGRTTYSVFIDCESMNDVIFMFDIIVENKDIDTINLESLIESFTYETLTSYYQRIKINSESGQSVTILVPYQFSPSGLGNIGYSPNGFFECNLNAWLVNDSLPVNNTFKIVSGKNKSGIKYEYTLDNTDSVFTYDIRFKLNKETLGIKFTLAPEDNKFISIEDILNSFSFSK